MLSKRFGTSTTSLGPLLGELGSLSSTGNTPNPYEKWSNGTDKMFLNGSGNGDSQNQVKKMMTTLFWYATIYNETLTRSFGNNISTCWHTMDKNLLTKYYRNWFLINKDFLKSNCDQNFKDSNLIDSSSFRQYGFSTSSSSVSGQLGSTSESIMDLSNKLMSQPIFPPKSQIKRQKMIYHCKFGEFGVLEGQFTEPSGVAVNAQNDIIVADTNNHRIQVRYQES